MISREQVEKIAYLARLTLTETEREHHVAELSRIVGYIEKINNLDLTNVRPMEYALEAQNIFREGDDVMVHSSVIAKALLAAPAKDGELFLVPKVL